MHYTIALVLGLLSCSLDWSNGRLLRVVTTSADAYFQPTSSEPEGFMVDLMADLAARLNIGTGEEVTYRFYRSPDGKYGTVNQSGHWDGLMGEVIKGEADLAAAPLTVTKERSKVVHFSHPFLGFSIVSLVKKPAPGAPFPFNSLADLKAKARAGNLTIGYVQHGSTEKYMQGHKDPVIRALHDISKAANTSSPYVDSVAAGVQRVRNDPKFVFFGEHSAFYAAMRSRPCDLAVAWQGMIGEGFFSFAFPKTDSGHQWMEKFNEAIVEAQQDGTIHTLTKRWWFEKSECEYPKQCICADNAEDHHH